MSKELVYQWMKEKQVPPEIAAVIYHVYESGYQHKSDGCSKVDEAGWPSPNPACVGHDWLYFTGSRSRQAADKWFYEAMLSFGMTRIRARARWFGVRLFGWRAWRLHRRKRPR